MTHRGGAGKLASKSSARACGSGRSIPTQCACRTARRRQSMIARMSPVARQMLVVALLLATVIGLFVAAQVGQLRLEDARARIDLGTQRHQAISGVRRQVRQAESSQRGYILLGNPEYLAPFQQAIADVTPALQRLDAAFAAASPATQA